MIGVKDRSNTSEDDGDAILVDVHVLIQQLRDTNYPKRRVRAAIALEEINDPRAVSALIEGLQDEDAELRKYSAKALVRLQSIRSVEALIEILRNPDEHWLTRKYAAEALGKIRGPRAIAALNETLSDAEPAVREVAVAAIRIDNRH